MGSTIAQVDLKLANPSGLNMTGNMTGSEEQSIPTVNATGYEDDGDDDPGDPGPVDPGDPDDPAISESDRDDPDGGTGGMCGTEPLEAC